MAGFSDWGGTSWAEDLDAAKSQATAWLSSTAGAKRWPAAATSFVTSAISASAEAADGWFSDDVAGFWAVLAATMDRYTGTKPTSWDKLRDTFAAAGGATVTTEKARDEGSVSTVVGGTVAASVEDLEDAAKAAKSSGPMVVLGLAALGVVVYAATRS